MLREFSLEGQRALVTGGGRGIGKAIALVMAEAGADVAVVARTREQVDQTADEVRRLGRRSVALQCDVSDSGQVDEAVAQATEVLGGIDILVNNAGQVAVGPLVPLPDAADADVPYSWERGSPMGDEILSKIMQTNLAGPVYLCRAVGPQMIERRRGKVINVTSTSDSMTYPYETAYASSKAALRMVTKVLAFEWGPYNVNVNGISPGWFVTEMTRAGFDDPKVRKERIESLPLRRLTDTRELGLLAVYLASPASDWMTGQVLFLDGGESGIMF